MAGILYFSYIFWWLWNLYPLDSFGLPGKTAGLVLISLIFVMAVAEMAFFWGLFGVLCQKISAARISSRTAPFILASGFVLAEYLRSFFFGVFNLGAGTFLGAHWTLGNIAYQFSDFSYILRTSSIWGIYGISFLAAYLISGIALSLIKKNYKNLLILLWVPALLIGINLLAPRSPDIRQEGRIPIAIVQTQIPSKVFYTADETIDSLTTKLELLEKSAEFIDSSENGRRGLIIFPEGSQLLTDLFKFLDEESVEKYFNELSEKEILVLDQIRFPEENSLKSKIVLVNSKTGIAATYDKKLLVPGGEFRPYLMRALLYVFSPSFRRSGFIDVMPGSDSNFIKFDDYKFVIAVCSELLSPSLIRNHNPDFIVGTNNFGLFNGGRLLERQMRSISVFRAVENGKYLVNSSNFGKSYIINPDGIVEQMASGADYELLTGTIVPNQGRTWYNYLGDWPILLLSLVIFGLAIRKNRNDKTG